MQKSTYSESSPNVAGIFVCLVFVFCAFFVVCLFYLQQSRRLILIGCVVGTMFIFNHPATLKLIYADKASTCDATVGLDKSTFDLWLHLSRASSCTGSV